MSRISLAAMAVLLLLVGPSAMALIPPPPPPPPAALGVPLGETDLFQLALNLEYLEAEFYLFSAYGVGLDAFAPELNGGGPPPIGGRKANLSPEVEKIAEMLALQEIGHIRIIREFLGAQQIPRPLIDIGTAWSVLFEEAAGATPSVPFDPYVNDLSWLLGAFTLPYVGLTAYVGANPLLYSVAAKELLAGVLGVEGGQDSLLRTTLWWKRNAVALPQPLKVVVMTGLITSLRDRLDGSDTIEDENIVVPQYLGAENRTTTNILSANADSLSYARNPAQTLSIVYGTGSPSKPGGFWPRGAAGNIANYYLTHPSTALGTPLY